MRPLVFLDFDGVLLSVVGRRFGWNPAAVDACNRLTGTWPGAAVVITSTWRIGRGVGDLRHVLRMQGVRASVVGVTPRPRPARGIVLAITRGEEIAAWLDGHGGRARPFVILDDDDADMAPPREDGARRSARVPAEGWDLGGGGGVSDAERVAAIRARHHRITVRGSGYTREACRCGDAWPCRADASLLLAALDQVTAENVDLRDRFANAVNLVATAARDRGDALRERDAAKAVLRDIPVTNQAEAWRRLRARVAESERERDAARATARGLAAALWLWPDDPAVVALVTQVEAWPLAEETEGR